MSDWLRVLFGAGLLLTEPKDREKLRKGLHDRVSDISGAAHDRYDAAVERLERVADAVQGKNHWAARTGNFLLGVGVGVGLGILFAPAAGGDTRQRIVDTATAAKDKVRSSIRKMPATGTEG